MLRGMETLSQDLERHLHALVGSTIETPSRGAPSRVLALDETRVLVGTDESPDGVWIPLADLRLAADMLVARGEIRVQPEVLGYREWIAPPPQSELDSTTRALPEGSTESHH